METMSNRALMPPEPAPPYRGFTDAQPNRFRFTVSVRGSAFSSFSSRTKPSAATVSATSLAFSVVSAFTWALPMVRLIRLDMGPRQIRFAEIAMASTIARTAFQRITNFLPLLMFLTKDTAMMTAMPITRATANGIRYFWQVCSTPITSSMLICNIDSPPSNILLCFGAFTRLRLYCITGKTAPKARTHKQSFSCINGNICRITSVFERQLVQKQRLFFVHFSD